MEAVEVNFLWDPYLPAGKLTMLEGDPGLGKSWISLGIATAISHGITPGPHPRKLPNGPGRVLIATAEDALNDTVKPRLELLEADSHRVWAIAATTPEEKEEDLTLNELGLIELEKAIREFQVDLVVIDPLVAYLGAKVDMHRANEIRPVLAQLAAIAERNGCAILTVRHLRKSTNETRAIYAGTGSIDFSAAVRSVLLVGEYQLEEGSDEQGLALVQHKLNIAPKGAAIGFSFGDGVQGFTWGEEIDWLRPHHLFGSLGRTGRPSKEKDLAAEWLRGFLTEPMKASDVIKAAKNAGIMERTLIRAKTELGVDSTKTGFGDSAWWWIPPWGDPDPRRMPASKGSGILAPFDTPDPI